MTSVQQNGSQQNTNFKHFVICCTSLGGGALAGRGWYKWGNAFLNNDGTLKDSFIKTIEKSLIDIKDEDFTKDIKWLSDSRKEIDGLKSIDDVIKYYLKTNKLSENDKKVILDNMKNMKLDEAKNFVKVSIETTDSRYKKYFNDIFVKAYDKNKRELQIKSLKNSLIV